MNARAIQFHRTEDHLEIQLCLDENPLTVAEVREAMQQAGFGRYFLLPEACNQLIADYVKFQPEAALRPELRLKKVIAERRNAVLIIKIADDKMSAIAEITAAFGGTPISANEVVKSAQEQGVSFGFHKEGIIALVTKASQAEPGALTSQVIALGRPMQPGLNARFESQVKGLQSRTSRPVQISGSKADLRDFGVIPSVGVGDAILRRLPPTKGVDGVTVTGEVTPAPPGVQLEFAPGEGCEISPTDADLLIASREGMPRLTENGASVDEVYAVKKVDLSTGHVQFRGAVIVNGDVTESMKVIAGGSVFVKGIMEGALIEAAGDVQIGGAIIGHQLFNIDAADVTFSTIVRAGGNVQCQLAQYAQIQCQGDFSATKQINHCSVEARAVLAGTEDKLAGKIVGGEFKLAAGLKAGSIGSPSESPTRIDLNLAIDPLVERQVALRQNILTIRQEMEQMREMAEQLKAGERNEAMVEQMRYLVEDFDAQKSIILALQEDIKLLEAERLAKLHDILVLVKQELFVGVEFKLGGDIVPVRRELGPSKVSMVEGKAVLEPWVAN